jgi:nitrate reductase gamma subunit
MDYVNQFFFGIYPYIALAVFLLGSLIRFDREQYTWRSESTQVLHQGSLRLGSILFHVGIIGLLGGHAVGLLTPVWVWDTLGVTHGAKQLFAMAAGGVMGTLCLVGILLLLARRLGNTRLRTATTFKDKIVLLWILGTLLLGLSSIFVSAGHLDGHVMVLLMTWDQHIVTLQADASSFVAEVPLIFKLHLFMGMTLFLIFPFTRLVHVWSGLASVTYVGRAWQLVRGR